MSFYICIVISRTGLVGGKAVYVITVLCFLFSPAQVWWGVGVALYLVDLMFITQTFMAADRLPRKHREIQEGKFCSNTFPSGIQA